MYAIRSYYDIPEDHGLDVAGRSEIMGYIVEPSVGDRPVGEPGVEHGIDGQLELLEWVLRETFPSFLLEDSLELPDEVP